ncbi:MAG TPA: tetratricopeptide repeat protein [Gemmatimonadaceae bacterium]
MLLASSIPLVARSQSTGRAPATMARADSAFDQGNRALARVLYGEVLANDSAASRAVFRLAQLDESNERALLLYRRYIALEPGDAWGHMAEGDLLGRMGRVEEALVAYAGADAVAPGERDVFIGKARLLERAGRSDQAAAELSSWLSRHPADGEAWDLLGRSEMRGGRPRSASGAFNKAAQRAVPGADRRLHAASAAAAPFITPEWTSLGDSDGNRTSRFGVALDAVPVDGLRLGASVRRETISGAVDETRGIDLAARFTAVPSRAVNVNAEVGAIRYDLPRQGPGPRFAGGSWTAIHTVARVRVRAPVAGPSLDLRIDRAPVGFNPLLVANAVVRSEARATIEVPFGALRARGVGRLGRMESALESSNGRVSVEGGLLLPLGSRWLPSVQYRVTAFDRASAAGYFAPQLARTAEAGAYFEAGGDGPVTLAADLGAGVQRITEHGAPAGGWARVWRAWAQGSVALGPSRSWSVEIEAYDAPFALEGASAAGSWRFLSVSTGLRWSLR